MNRKMPRKIPADAFEEYVNLGLGRSYTALAKKYDVTKRAITFRAAEEHWQERLHRIEEEVRQEAERKLIDELSEMRATHVKALRAMTIRAIEALKEHKLESAMEAARVVEIAVKLERLMLGDAEDRPRGNIESITREEIDRLLTIDMEQEVGSDSPPALTAGEDGDDAEEGDDW